MEDDRCCNFNDEWKAKMIKLSAFTFSLLLPVIVSVSCCESHAADVGVGASIRKKAVTGSSAVASNS